MSLTVKGALVTLLAADAGVAALAGGRVWPDEAPQAGAGLAVPRPYLLVHREGEQKVVANDGINPTAAVAVRVEAWADTEADGVALGAAARAVLDALPLTAGQGFQWLGLFPADDEQDGATPPAHAETRGRRYWSVSYQVWAAPFDPSFLSPVAGYRNAEGSGPTVADSSGAGFTAALGISGSRIPAWDPPRGIKFTATDQLLSAPGAVALAAKAGSVTLVARCAGVGTGAVRAFFSDNGTTWVAALGSKGNAVWVGGGGPGVDTATAEPVDETSPNCITVVFSNPARVYINRHEAKYLTQLNESNKNPSGNLWVGWLSGDQGLGNDNDLFELWAFAGQLTADQAFGMFDFLRGDLAARGVALGDYSGIPAAGQPCVCFLGDSLTYGTASSAAHEYPRQCLALLATPLVLLNLGVGGYQVGDVNTPNTLAAIAAGSADAVLNYAAHSANVCVIWGGTNDVQAGASAATLYARIQAICNARKAAGAQVIFLTTIKRGTFDAGQNTVRTTVNGDVTSDAATLSSTTADGVAIRTGASYADVVADVAGATNLQNTADTTYYFADGVHLVDAGYAIIARSVRAALALLGVT